MTDRCRQNAVAAILAACAVNLSCPAPAIAALGGDATSVIADAQHMRGALRSTALQEYDIHEITADNGLRVREFLNRVGIVFAVTWDGPVLPDLQTLLGANFAAYKPALAVLKQPGLQRSLRIASRGLVVESGGHLRAYAGRAYLPALIPVVLQAADLR